MGGLRIALGLSQLFAFQDFAFIKCLQNYNILQKWTNIHEEGPAWTFRNFFQAKASEVRPSNLEGSKKRILISNFAAWFLMASILAALKWRWSSNSYTLTAKWSTSFLKVWSSRDLMCYIFLSSSWYLFCKISTNKLWSRKESIRLLSFYLLPVIGNQEPSEEFCTCPFHLSNNLFEFLGCVNSKLQ